MNKRGVGCRLLSVLTITLLGLAAGRGEANTKIAPSEAKAGAPFTLIDTQDARLVDGAIAVFICGSTEVAVSLRTHKPFKTAHGQLPDDIAPGAYSVSVRQPQGAQFQVDSFTVTGVVSGEPSITPLTGSYGTSFTITDPLGRIGGTDQVLFYPEGEDPLVAGVWVDDVTIPNCATLQGSVPVTAPGPNYVSVRADDGTEARFADLPFFVIGFREPFVEPAAAAPGYPFTIYDDAARMGYADRIIFTVVGDAPETGTVVENVSFSSDGKTATGTVPGTLLPGTYNVTVHGGDPLLNPPLFAAIAFTVE